jgi:hypothetical protein
MKGIIKIDRDRKINRVRPLPSHNLTGGPSDLSEQNHYYRLLIALGGGEFVGIQETLTEPLVLFNPPGAFASAIRTTLAVRVCVLRSEGAEAVRKRIRESAEEFSEETQ